MSTTTKFHPETSIGDLSGRVYFVTGGTAGLGAGSVRYLAAKNPAKIFFSGRNKAAADELIADIKAVSPKTELIFIKCDLSSLKSVQQAAQQFISQSDRLDVLMNNAGVMALAPGLSEDGYEIQFATNHLGHALLIKLLAPIMLRTAEQPNSDVRIVNLSSVAYANGPPCGIEIDTLKTTQASLGGWLAPSKWLRYGQSKLANLLYNTELAEEYPSIKSVAIHPGSIKTGLHGGNTMIDWALLTALNLGNWTPVEEGSYNQTWAATTPKENLVNGAYYEPVGVKVVPKTALANDRNLSKKLFEWTEKELANWS
ncbi:retinol dehydrogenase 14 [Xylariaceae sp. FL1019]|nr:retinol dehydrogenase 14 [Xylariaceae sp. FL1019]